MLCIPRGVTTRRGAHASKEGGREGGGTGVLWGGDSRNAEIGDGRLWRRRIWQDQFIKSKQIHLR